jgi:ubiquitin-protein ligase
MQILRDEGFPVFALASSILVWHIFVPAPLPGTDVARVFWDLLVVFPLDYPYVPPVYRFMSVPPLKNVSPAGRVRNAVIDGYHPRQHIATVVKSIQALFKKEDSAAIATLESAADKPAFDVAKYDELLACRTAEPWLPLPDMDYLAIAYGEVLTGGKALPARRKKPDLGVHAYSQISSKKINGEPAIIHGIVIDPDEKRYFKRC